MVAPIGMMEAMDEDSISISIQQSVSDDFESESVSSPQKDSEKDFREEEKQISMGYG